LQKEKCVVVRDLLGSGRFRTLARVAILAEAMRAFFGSEARLEVLLGEAGPTGGTP
jgi:hypothetical protein